MFSNNIKCAPKEKNNSFDSNSKEFFEGRTILSLLYDKYSNDLEESSILINSVLFPHKNNP